MNELMMVLNYYYLQVCAYRYIDVIHTFTYDVSFGLFTLLTLLPELISFFLKNDKIDFHMSEFK